MKIYNSISVEHQDYSRMVLLMGFRGKNDYLIIRYMCSIEILFLNPFVPSHNTDSA